jgi:hypothetical protein
MMRDMTSLSASRPKAANDISPTETEDIAQVVRAVFDDLDMQQLAIFRQLPGARRLAIAFDLCEFARSLIVAAVRNQYPDISEAELNERVGARVALTWRYPRRVQE